MFKDGRILYFDPFIFVNGATPKKKYFLVLKNNQNGILLASLPTSKDHIPADLDFHEGIYEIPERYVSAYVFPANKEIATNPFTFQRFSFPKDTFIYGEQVETFPETLFRQQITQKITTIDIIGDLDESIYQEIMDFIKASSTVRRRYKKMI